MRAKIAIVGLGNQGRSWALNLRDSGMPIEVHLRETSPRRVDAAELGLTCRILGGALSEAEIVCVLIPDDAMPDFFRDFGHLLRPGQSLVFAHGFTLHYRTASWPDTCDLILVSPKGVGSAVRKRFEEGGGVPALLAVHCDATGRAWEVADLIAGGLGASRAGTYKVTVREEVEVNLFAEQALLCGGLPALVRETYRTLIERGYPAAAAYLECVHEVAFMGEILQREGVHGLLNRVSPTARFGGLRGASLIGQRHLKEVLEALLSDIENGSFAKDLAEEAANGFARTRLEMERLAEEPVEEVGRELRHRMERKKGAAHA